MSFEQQFLGDHGDERKKNHVKSPSEKMWGEMESMRKILSSIDTCVTCSRRDFDDDEFVLQLKVSPELTYKGPLCSMDEELVQRLWDLAPVSGFGDMQTMTTKIDPEVRNAREIMIDSSTCVVNDEVGNVVKHFWSNRFLPSLGES